jgi:tetratricopeptide (TPR) repeat protein
MLRVPLFLFCSLAALAQPSPPQDPLDTAIQAVWQNGNGRFEEAAAAREQARALLQRAPAASPRFGGWVQQVAQLYQNSSFNAQARAILQEALARTGPLPDWHPSRIAVLIALGESWRQDGNLLKALGYLEQEAAAQAAAPPAAAQPAKWGVIGVNGRTFFIDYAGPGYSGKGIYAYIRLADLYRQLGRPDAVAAIAVKIRTLGSNDESSLAQFYQQQGQHEEAAAIYQKLAEQAADPQAKASAWQSLANLYAGRQHYTDAIASIRQAIAAVQSSDNPGIRSHSLWLSQNLAGYMREAGLLDQADQVYQQLQQQNRGGPQESEMLGQYAQYLADTKRGAQGESLLTDYLAGHSYLDPPERMNVLFSLANVARRTGDSKTADEYQQAGQALQPAQPQPVEQIRIGEELQKAQTAIGQHRLDDAYGLALHAIDTAAHAADGQQVQWLVFHLAGALAANKEPARAEQLFQRLFALGQSWSVDSMQPPLAARQNYVLFLMGQPDRLGEVPAAIEQYRRVLTDANGPDSASLAAPLRMKIDLESFHPQRERADASARELLELQERLSGNTSEPYFGDLQTAARIYEAAGDSARALPLLRQAITIADLLGTDFRGRRSRTRMDAALALARLGQFDEAETLGEEAVALQRLLREPIQPLAPELEQIRRMKQAAATAIANRADK